MKNSEGGWTNHALDAEPVRLTPNGPTPLAPRERLGALSELVLMPSHDSRGSERWILICQPGGRTRVNCRPVVIGARVLADRDAITLGAGSTVWFSAERLRV